MLKTPYRKTEDFDTPPRNLWNNTIIISWAIQRDGSLFWKQHPQYARGIKYNLYANEIRHILQLENTTHTSFF